ncbi:L,D-transpeptidase [Priestia megaterium]|uniref:L,D-transpeptidase n=1 Tax=Priestia megaterium TaxID=1404 RepID=UPI002FFEB76E
MYKKSSFYTYASPRKNSLHGNNNESSIRKYVSQGSVRMYNADVEKLYDKVQVGTPVGITYSYKSFVDLTKAYVYKFKGYNMKSMRWFLKDHYPTKE